MPKLGLDADVAYIRRPIEKRTKVNGVNGLKLRCPIEVERANT